MTTVDEIVRLLRLGMCSPGRHASEGCSTCDACNAAIETVERLADVAHAAQTVVDCGCPIHDPHGDSDGTCARCEALDALVALLPDPDET
jgi:hypothetical protein